MKIGLIDIGSNSVRLMLWADGNTLYKKIKTTRLGDGLNFSPYLKTEACGRTAEAVAAFAKEAKDNGADGVYAFATAAVRSCKNPEVFLNRVKALCGICVDVVSGQTEAALAASGALGGSDGGIIDVGGASTEVTVRLSGETVYFKSVDIGTVRILDAAGRDIEKIDQFIGTKISEYGDNDFSSVKFYAVGGTASRLGAIKNNLLSYDPAIIGGTVLSRTEICALAERLTATTVDEIRRTTVCGNSADVIGGGAALMAAVMDKLKIDSVTVSESDNLEGYLNLKILKGGTV